MSSDATSPPTTSLEMDTTAVASATKQSEDVANTNLVENPFARYASFLPSHAATLLTTPSDETDSHLIWTKRLLLQMATDSADLENRRQALLQAENRLTASGNGHHSGMAGSGLPNYRGTGHGKRRRIPGVDPIRYTGSNSVGPTRTNRARRGSTTPLSATSRNPDRTRPTTTRNGESAQRFSL